MPPAITLDKAIKFTWSVMWRSFIISILLFTLVYACSFVFIFIITLTFGGFESALAIANKIFVDPDPLLPDTMEAIYIILSIILNITLAIFCTYKATQMTIKSCVYKTFVFDQKNISKTDIFKYSLFFMIFIPIISGLLGNLLIFFQHPHSTLIIIGTQVIILIWYNKMVMSRKFLGVFLPIQERPTSDNALDEL